MNVYRLSMLVHAIVVTMLFAIALAVIGEGLQPPAPDDPNADWHWLDLWVMGFVALVILGYMLLLGLSVWFATGRKNWIPIAITMDLGAAVLAAVAAFAWRENGIDPMLVWTAAAALTGAILVKRLGAEGPSGETMS